MSNNKQNKVKNRFQKKLSDKVDPALGLTDYDAHFLPNPEKGPLESEPAFSSVYNLDFFSENLIRKSREEFKSLLLDDISEDDLKLIEEALASYTKSSTNVSPEKLNLYHSIIEAYGELHLLQYEQNLEDVKQNIPLTYFEDYQKILVDKDEIKTISKESLDLYIESAQEVTKKYLSLWAENTRKEFNDPTFGGSYETIHLYRGINSIYYYSSKRRVGDFLSIFSGVAKHEMHPFFEKGLLTSYTISPRMADQFAVGYKRNHSQRKCSIITNVYENDKRIFSSFLVSEAFSVNQYEILCLPSQKSLSIRETKNDTIEANFELHSTES